MQIFNLDTEIRSDTTSPTYRFAPPPFFQVSLRHSLGFLFYFAEVALGAMQIQAFIILLVTSTFPWVHPLHLSRSSFLSTVTPSLIGSIIPPLSPTSRLQPQEISTVPFSPSYNLINAMNYNAFTISQSYQFAPQSLAGSSLLPLTATITGEALLFYAAAMLHDSSTIATYCQYLRQFCTIEVPYI